MFVYNGDRHVPFGQCYLTPDPIRVQVYLVNANKTDVLLLIGAIYYQMGNYEQCIAFNDRCILLDPHMAEAHANLANALQQLGNFDMAVIYYQVHCHLCMQVYLP